MRGGQGRDKLLGGSGTDECAGEEMSGCEMTAVSAGDRGLAVRYLQQRLSEAMLYRGPIDGVFPEDRVLDSGEASNAWEFPGSMTAAIYAFHKLHRSPAGEAWTPDDRVSAAWTLADWRRIRRFSPEVPVDREAEPNRFEVDARHEVMWLMLDGELAGIFHVSVGGEFTYVYRGSEEVAHTPRGDMDFYKYWAGHEYPLCTWMYRAWYYKHTHRGMALHGYCSVPPYPASHGCVRVIYDDADWIHSRIGGSAAVGDGVMPIHIWDG